MDVEQLEFSCPISGCGSDVTSVENDLARSYKEEQVLSLFQAMPLLVLAQKGMGMCTRGMSENAPTPHWKQPSCPSAVEWSG